jgi:hypothetical protein
MEAIVFTVGLALLVYLIFKRIEEKKKEDFENREN